MLQWQVHALLQAADPQNTQAQSQGAVQVLAAQACFRMPVVLVVGLNPIATVRLLLTVVLLLILPGVMVPLAVVLPNSPPIFQHSF